MPVRAPGAVAPATSTETSDAARGRAGGRDRVVRREVEGAQDERDVAAMDGGRGLDVRPQDRSVGPGRRLDEPERVAREECPPDGDLGDRPRAGRGLVGQPRRQRADDDLVRQHAIPTRQGDAEELERERPAGPGRRVGRHAGRQVGRDDERARADEDRRPGAPAEPMGEGMVGEGAVGLDGVGHDLGHRIGREQVDPLEGGHDGALGRSERRRRRSRAGRRRGAARRHGRSRDASRVIARWLPVGADSTSDRARPHRLARLPVADVEARVGHPVGQLAPDRHLDPDQVDAGGDQVGRLLEGGLDLGLAEGDPEPRPIRLAEHPDGLAPHRPLGVDPLDGGARQALRLGLGDDAPVGLAEQLALEREVDRPRRDVQRELLRLEVVFEQRHRERQGDPVPERARVAGQPAVDRRPGQRPSGGIEPAHPEQAQDRPFLADVVEARARAPHAPASASARATRRSSGQSDVMRRVSGISVAGTWHLDPPPGRTVPQAVCAQYGPAALARDVGPARCVTDRRRSASRLPARKPRYATPDRPTRSGPRDRRTARRRARSPRGPPPRHGCSRPR